MSEEDRLVQDILFFVGDQEDDHGLNPSVREIGNGVKIVSMSKITSILNDMAAPENDLLDKPEAGKHRGYRLSRHGRDIYERHKSDVKRRIRRLHVGRVRAGAMLHEWEDVLSQQASLFYFDPDDPNIIELSMSMFPGKGDNVFALRVAGDSMVDAMINDGDIVLVQKQQDSRPPRDGTMVVARDHLDGETVTLKHYHDKGDEIELRPANRKYDPIRIAKQRIDILGIVLMILRWPQQAGSLATPV